MLSNGESIVDVPELTKTRRGVLRKAAYTAPIVAAIAVRPNVAFGKTTKPSGGKPGGGKPGGKPGGGKPGGKPGGGKPGGGK